MAAYTSLSKSLTNTFRYVGWLGIGSGLENIYLSSGSTQYQLAPTSYSDFKWQTKSWSGMTNFSMHHFGYIWTDGKDIYFSNGTTQKVLNKSTNTWSDKTWTGLTKFDGGGIWTDGANIYYTNPNGSYVLDVETSTWTTQTWGSLPGSINTPQIWTDGNNIYYSYDSTHYVFNKETQSWTTKTWSGMTSFEGQYVWTDGTNIYYSSGSTQKVLNKSTSTWSNQSWSGLTSFMGYEVWTDGNAIYYSGGSSSSQYKLSGTSWSSKSWSELPSGYSFLSAMYIWSDYNVVCKGTRYNNSTDLSNMNPGDIITYNRDASSGYGVASTTIDFAGKNVHIEMYGMGSPYFESGRDGGPYYAKGGKAEFDLDTSKVTTPTFTYWYSRADYCYHRLDLAYGSSDSLYYRIAVPGNSGKCTKGTGYGYQGLAVGGNGGGLAGQRGYGAKQFGATNGAGQIGGYGATQTAGGQSVTENGANITVDANNRNGSFGGDPAARVKIGSNYNDNGGYGWYGAGAGGNAAGYSGNACSGGGGSGFILGLENTSYPSGYMGDDTSLINEISSAISNGVLTQGVNPTRGQMIVTILEEAGPSLTSIAVTQLPTTTTYMVGDTFDPTGLVITGYYDDNTSATIPSTDYTLSTPDMSTAGTKTITVTCGSVTTTFTILVTAVTSIAVTTMPTKTAYFIGETFDPTGLVVTAYYSDSTSAVVPSSDYTLTSPDMTTAGTKTITVSYSGQTTTFNITVSAIKVASISVETMPTTTQYEVGETFDPTGLTIRKTYNNGDTSVISSGYTLSSPDMSTPGTKTVTVSYTESSITKTTSFNITVANNSYVRIYDGSQWQNATVNYYYGRAWHECEVYTPSSIGTHPTVAIITTNIAGGDNPNDWKEAWFTGDSEDTPRPSHFATSEDVYLESWAKGGFYNMWADNPDWEYDDRYEEYSSSCGVGYFDLNTTASYAIAFRYYSSRSIRVDGDWSVDASGGTMTDISGNLERITLYGFDAHIASYGWRVYEFINTDYVGVSLDVTAERGYSDEIEEDIYISTLHTLQNTATWEKIGG